MNLEEDDMDRAIAVVLRAIPGTVIEDTVDGDDEHDGEHGDEHDR